MYVQQMQRRLLAIISIPPFLKRLLLVKYFQIKYKICIFNTSIDLLSITHLHLLFYPGPDPCDELTCNGTNAICKVVFGTGKPFCACASGFRGDPNVKCGKYIFHLKWEKSLE